MLQSIEETLKTVIDITTPAIGWMNHDINSEWPGDRPDALCREERANRSAKCSSPARDEGPSANSSPVVIHTRRIGQMEFDHHDRFHGGVLLLAEDD